MRAAFSCRWPITGCGVKKNSQTLYGRWPRLRPCLTCRTFSGFAAELGRPRLKVVPAAMPPEADVRQRQQPAPIALSWRIRVAFRVGCCPLSPVACRAWCLTQGAAACSTSIGSGWRPNLMPPHLRGSSRCPAARKKVCQSSGDGAVGHHLLECSCPARQRTEPRTLPGAESAEPCLHRPLHQQLWNCQAPIKT